MCCNPVSGGSGYHEVVVSGHSEGSFSSLLHCSVDGDHEKNFSLHVQGTIQVICFFQFSHFHLDYLQGPIVLLDCSNMNFGLILCGRSSSLQVCVSNKSSCLINFSLRQLVQCRNNNFIVSYSMKSKSQSIHLCSYSHCNFTVLIKTIKIG